MIYHGAIHLSDVGELPGDNWPLWVRDSSDQRLYCYYPSPLCMYGQIMAVIIGLNLTHQGFSMSSWV
jgi:hypothetical protein